MRKTIKKILNEAKTEKFIDVVVDDMMKQIEIGEMKNPMNGRVGNFVELNFINCEFNMVDIPLLPMMVYYRDFQEGYQKYLMKFGVSSGLSHAIWGKFRRTLNDKYGITDSGEINEQTRYDRDLESKLRNEVKSYTRVKGGVGRDMNYLLMNYQVQDIKRIVFSGTNKSFKDYMRSYGGGVNIKDFAGYKKGSQYIYFYVS